MSLTALFGLPHPLLQSSSPCQLFRETPTAAAAPITPNKRPPARYLTAPRHISVSAISALIDVYTNQNAVIHRGSCAHALGRQAASALLEARQSIAQHINASSHEEIVFAPSVASAMAILARSSCASLKKGDEVILAPLEYDYTVWAWRTAAEERGVVIRRAELGSGINFMSIAPLVTPRTRAIVMQHVTPLGEMNPVQEIGQFTRSMGVPLVVDATQSIPWHHVDVKKLGCDFLLADGVGFGAPPGAAFWYGKSNFLRTMPPVLGTENALEEVSFGSTVRVAKQRNNWAPVPMRFESGMFPLAAARGLAVALKERELLGRSTDETLGVKLFEAVRGVKRIQIVGSCGSLRAPAVCFVVDGCSVLDVANSLERSGVFVSAGCHGACVAHGEDLNLDGTLRVVLDPARHDESDIAHLVRALKENISSAPP